MKNYKFILIIILLCSCGTIKESNSYILKITYLDNTKEKKYAEFYHDPNDINMILVDNCIKYGEDKKDVLCGVKSFKAKKIVVRLLNITTSN